MGQNRPSLPAISRGVLSGALIKKKRLFCPVLFPCSIRRKMPSTGSKQAPCVHVCSMETSAADLSADNVFDEIPLARASFICLELP